MSGDVRILLVADSHIGFDLPLRPRIGRRRRGFDFLANYSASLEPALAREIDIVVHAGDVFNRSSVPPSVAYQAYEPLRRVADLGIPVFIVPGNHERSRLPHTRFASHPLIHVFDHPRTFVVTCRGAAIAFAGFPYERRDVRTRFAELVEQTGWREPRADHRLLCIHHCVEGATVGPGDFTFTTASDVIRTRDILPDFAAVLSGHIHRHQVLTRDLSRRSLPTPVLYPGSIERTSFAEMDEAKGFMVLHLGENGGVQWEFRGLPARPMIVNELQASGMDARQLQSAIHAIVAAAPSDAVLSIRVDGVLSDAHWRALSAARVRELAPDTMNVEVRPVGGFQRESPPRRPEIPGVASQLSLYQSLY